MKKYIHLLDENLTQVNSKMYATGNKQLDILTNYLLFDLDHTITVIMEGQFNRTDIPRTSLSIIYGNLLTNAKEELERNVGSKDRKLKISFTEGKFNTEIVVENTTEKQEVRIGKSEKKDKKVHGYGIKNVKEEVEKYNGKATFEVLDNVFTARVLFPIELPFNKL